MANAKEAEKKAPEETPSRPASDLVTDEMKEAAEASAKRRAEKKDDGRSGVGTLRRQGGSKGGGLVDLKPSDIPYPAEVHGKDFEFYGPMGAGAVIPEGTERVDYSGDQEFMIDPDRVVTLSFDKPGRNLPPKRLYNIKALHKDGRLVQLPFEPQVQNNAGGDPEDAIGLNRYRRKGIHLFIDMTSMIPVYCAAWGCWAQAKSTGNFVGFCSLRHAQHTLPNAYKGGGEIARGLMEAGVTTSSVWADG